VGGFVMSLRIQPGLARIRPDIGGQVGMCIVDSRIDDRYDDLAVAGLQIPCFRRIDVGIGCATRLPVVVQGVLLAEFRILVVECWVIRRFLYLFAADCRLALDGTDMRQGGQIGLDLTFWPVALDEYLARQSKARDRVELTPWRGDSSRQNCRWVKRLPTLS